MTAQIGAASAGSEDKPGVAGKDTIEYAQNILAARKGLQPSLTEDRHSLIDLMQHSLGSQAWLATVCNEIAKAAKATASGASQISLRLDFGSMFCSIICSFPTFQARLTMITL